MSSPAPAVPATGAAAPAAAPTAPAPEAPPVARCDNCGASVPGRYCGACGQRLEPPIHSLGHFLRVAAEDVTHADSRLWRTLAALLVKPGYLTREFLTGRRARYLPPVRLYLVLSVVFFLWAAALPRNAEVLQISTNDSGDVSSIRVSPLANATGGAGGDAAAPQAAESAAQVERECGQFARFGIWSSRLAPAVRAGCIRSRADNGRSLRQSVLHNLPRAMFLFLPLLAALMMLLYWRPRHYYAEHLLFFVHNHAFVFVIVMLAWALGALVPPLARWIHAAVWLYVVWYLYRSLRVVYGQGGLATAAKLVVLSLFYLVSGALMMALTSLYSLVTA